jgi:hypothetical protein
VKPTRLVRSALVAVAAATALGYLAQPSRAAPGMLVGMKDDAWLLHGPGTLQGRVAELDSLGVDIVRFTLRWDEIARTQPRNGRNPNDPAYRWSGADAVLATLRKQGIEAVLTLVGTPAWANGGHGPEAAPLRAKSFADFAHSAALRYPSVRRWLIWNEPNQRRWLQPTTPRLYVERLLNPAYAAIKQANTRALVAGGVTAPRGNAGGVSPLAWIRGMAAADARLDAYAHNPYPLQPQVETPSTGGCSKCETITMATLDRLISAVRNKLGSVRIWLTEYGYQTNPPDPYLGVSPELQARYLAEAAYRAWKAPYVDMLINFLYQDDGGGPSGWQSGLKTASGVAKPARRMFMLPLVQVARTSDEVELWGQVRPRAGAQRYRLQRLRAGRWEWVSGAQVTDPTGVFTERLSVPRGTKLRFWSVGDGVFSPTLTVR